ncbi:helix-turn-helix domain-containing protein [Saccharibacillus brassicae]|uniref:Helix-turn-helix transcriptional regulator n=1 Tax=Saccharibacillus brassicae TaxID=2583377 RepID=A0A4Y6UT85_SACBS|nr:helix-turn-helix transcriptional regulator [Saccharibacillus brassicae]QDH19788.1 helix-turn-helix transcriptional regulator [Saccharibacillus brassicae]
MNAKEKMDYKLKRISKGIKQKDIAKELQVSAALVSYFENDKREMTPTTIQHYKSMIDN